MTLCNNLSRKRGVGVFSRVDIFSRDYGMYASSRAEQLLFHACMRCASRISHSFRILVLMSAI